MMAKSTHYFRGHALRFRSTPEGLWISKVRPRLAAPPPVVGPFWRSRQEASGEGHARGRT